MRKAILLTFLSVSLVACQQSNPKLEAKLDEIGTKLDAIEKKIASGGGGPAARQPQRPNRPRPGRPDPATTYAVPLGDSPHEGPENAMVTIIKAYEYACPFCQRVNPTLAQLKKDYGDKLKVVYRQYVVHPQTATIPALAACAAGNQGKFTEMNKLLWEKAYAAGRNFSQDNMEKLAKEAGLNMGKFKKDMEGSCKETIKKDQSELAKFGVRGTPAFFVNGRPISGAQPIQNFKRVIDEEMKKAEAAVKSGTKVADVYKKLVLEKGKKSL